MNKSAKILAVLALVAGAAALALHQTQRAPSPEAAPTEHRLRFGNSFFNDTLEPTDNYNSWGVVRLGIGECLTKFDRAMRLQPWLAESWSVSDDGLTWTFRIDDRATFSNGKKVTALDVERTIARTLELSARARAMFQYQEIRSQGQELTITTGQPVATLPGILSDPLFLIIDNDVTGRDYADEGPISTGPYRLKEISSTRALLERNPHYWDGEVPFDYVESLDLRDPNTRAMALQAGEIDVAVNLGYGDMALFSGSQDFNVSSIASLRVALARINSAPGRILNDIRVRHALLSALDRRTYCESLLHGTYRAGTTPIPPSLDYGSDVLQGQDPNGYDPDRARALLAEAGWSDTDGDGYLEKDGRKLELDFMYYTARAELPIFAEATQSDAKAVGIKINLHNVGGHLMDQVGLEGRYDLLISNILTMQAGDPETYINLYWKTNRDGSNPQNGSGYSNPQFDELSDRLASEFEPATRRELVMAMQKILMDDGATLIFGYPETNMVSSTAIEGVEIQPCDYYWITTHIRPAQAQ